MSNLCQGTFDRLWNLKSQLSSSLKSSQLVSGLMTLSLESHVARCVFGGHHWIGVKMFIHGMYHIQVVNHLDGIHRPAQKRVSADFSATLTHCCTSGLVATAEARFATAFRFCNARGETAIAFSCSVSLVEVHKLQMVSKFWRDHGQNGTMRINGHMAMSQLSSLLTSGYELRSWTGKLPPHVLEPEPNVPSEVRSLHAQSELERYKLEEI